MATGRDLFRSGDFFVGAAQSMVVLALGLFALKVVPQFEKIFMDFGTTLPTMTIILIKVSRILAYFWYLTALPVLLWPLVNWGIVSLLSPRPEVVLPKELWYFLTWGIIVLIIAIAPVALLIPLISLSRLS